MIGSAERFNVQKLCDLVIFLTIYILFEYIIAENTAVTPSGITKKDRSLSIDLY